MNTAAHAEHSIDINTLEVNAAQIDHSEPAAIPPDTKETFIPISRYDLQQSLNKPENWPEGTAQSAMRVLQHLSAWRHDTYYKKLLKLNELYITFNPDRDTKPVTQLNTKKDLIAQKAELKSNLIEILKQANYQQIDHEKLNEYFEAKGPYGLNLEVDMSEFEDVLIYFRGSEDNIISKRSWKTLFLWKEKTAIPVFQRLFLLLKLKNNSVRLREIMAADETNEKQAQKKLTHLRKNLPVDLCPDSVYLKMFKNIPQSDLEMLFPNIKIKLRPFDKLKLYATAGGGTLGGLFATATKISAAAASPIALVAAIFGLCGMVFRQVMKFFNQRNQYMMVLAQNLYFHNLANNRGALTLMIDRAEEEDIKEDMLLYSYLTRHKTCLSKLQHADQEIENYLTEKFNIDIDYDFTDALNRLMGDGLVYEDDEGFINALSPDDACHHLVELRMKSLNL
ncbi:MAG: DUF3754 domain-containing protein [Pseudomonadota bacterium]